MLSVGLLFLMFFLAFEGAVVQADDEDYDPCKAGKVFFIYVSSSIPFSCVSFLCQTSHLSSCEKHEYQRALLIAPISSVVRLTVVTKQSHSRNFSD